MKIFGCEVDRENQVEMILENHPETFNIVKINYSFEWLTYFLTGPMLGFMPQWFLFNVFLNKIKEAILVVNKDSSSKINESVKTSSSLKTSLPPVWKW